MKVLTIVDLDTKREGGKAANKMVVNNSERAEIARHYADQFSRKEQTAAFFAKMFAPELVELDVIEDQAQHWLKQIEARGAQIMYLTSRPHTMSEETRAWLAENNVSHPVIYKYYGTGKPDANGKPDTGNRFVKTPAWKAREIQYLLDELQPDWLIFVDDEESNRAAVAEIGDPRVLIRCSLEDAATHDFQRHQIDESAPPFLRRLQELAGILEEREAFESAAKWEADISHPLIPGQEEPGIIVHLEAWSAGAYAPGAEPGQRFYRYSELTTQLNEMIEEEIICALEVTCDQAGRIASVKMAQPGPAFSLLNKLEDSFDMAKEQEKAQKWADEYMSSAIAEHGYVEAARVVRGMKTIGRATLDAYMEHIREKNEEIKAAFQGRRRKASQ